MIRLVISESDERHVLAAQQRASNPDGRYANRAQDVASNHGCHAFVIKQTATIAVSSLLHGGDIRVNAKKTQRKMSKTQNAVCD